MTIGWPYTRREAPIDPRDEPQCSECGQAWDDDGRCGCEREEQDDDER